MRYFCLCLFVSLIMVPGAARADCSNPSSVAGGMIYNSDYQTMQFCDGAQWWSMKGDTMGPIRIAPANNAACNSSMEGGLRYNSVNKMVEFCNGSAWNSIIVSSDAGTPSTPPATAGYFVITSATYNGNLGDFTGANSKCLTDLNGHDWMGKTDATSRGIITSGHIRAWLCDTLGGCQDAVAGATYYFAVSGDNTKGGASFTADASGKGPGNTQNWSGTNYFDGSKQYWTGRLSGSSTLWGDTYHSDGANCYSWNSNGSGNYGEYGVSLGASSGRWDTSNIGCNTTTQHLVCFVDP